MDKIYTCPGINDFIRPTPEYIACGNCSEQVEIWSDESEAECDGCGGKVSRNKASCLEWCRLADKCKEIIDQKHASTP
jgi:hypothetical protein